MRRLVHLTDDTGMGGVSRVLAEECAAPAPGWQANMRAVRARWRLPPRLRADVVVVNLTMAWSKLPFLLLLRLFHRGRLVVVEHSYTRAYEALRVPPRHRWRFRLLLRIAYGLADRVVAVSLGQAAWLATLVPAGRLAVIQQAMDMAGPEGLPPPAAHGGPLRLGAYGRFADQKGLDVLLEAMRHVSPARARLLIAGAGPMEPALRAAASRLPHVTIGGPTDGPLPLLRQVDAVVVPSRWEAFGLVALEARAAARPVIASDIDGLAEQVPEGTGLRVPPDSPAALAAAILRLAEADRRGMQLAARASAAGAHDRKIAAWARLLDELVPVA